MIKRIGIISGVDVEAASFLPQQTGAGEPLHGFLIRNTEFAGRQISVTCSGIGKVNAAMAAMMLVEHYQVQLLVVIGTAGKLSDIEGDCFQIVEAVQGDYGASRRDGFAHYSAGAWPIGVAHIEPFHAAATPDIGLPAIRIVSGDSFVENPDHARRLHERLGGDLIDMETAAVAQAALRMDVPWAAIKATTDNANSSSSGDFQHNLQRAARDAAQAAERMISALPPVK
ncbi:MAG: 5'-methylthioadenosine/S-adenosylhomocysteine nucleosidase [Sphingorhabdus sp.]